MTPSEDFSIKDANDTYLTIDAPSEGLYKEKGSRFIAYAYPVVSEEEVKEIVERIKTENYGARHHCYAYRLGNAGERYRAVDDGEPSSTAGKPILGQISSCGLTNVVVVVVRYFGGIKLGVSGLITAYRTAAADALNNALFVERRIESEIRIRFGYTELNDVMKLIKEFDLRIVEHNFDNVCEMVVAVRRKEEEIFFKKADRVSGLSFL